MTEEELSASIGGLRSDMATLTDEWTAFLRLESTKRETADNKAVDEVDRWERQQGFLNKHGPKIASLAFAAMASGLAWYGAQIRGEIHAEQRAANIDANISSNKTNFNSFKSSAEGDIQDLQLGDIEQTIMMEAGFERLEKAITVAHPNQLGDDDSLPPLDPTYEKTASDARTKKAYYDKHGKLPNDKTKKPAQ